MYSPNNINLVQIIRLLKRNYPMLLIDGVTHVEPGIACEAFKNLTYNEWFFPAHFEGHPIMPGSLQIEAFTQATAIALLHNRTQKMEKKIPILFAGVDKARFYGEISPGMRLDMHIKVVKVAMGIATAKAIGEVENQKVSECQITYKV